MSTPEDLFAERVRTARVERGWSQADVAERMKGAGFGWHQTTVSRLENGAQGVSLNEAAALAVMFELDAGAVLMGTSEADDQPFSPLVGAIFTQMLTDSQATTNALLDIRRAQLRDVRAELYAIRQGIAELLGHPWTPSSEAVSRAVFAPTEALRNEYLERYAEEDE